MQRTVLAFTIILIASCSAPKELKKSGDVSPSCYCEGSSKYTIIMDAGMGNWSLFYQPVFQKIKHKFRVCLIDRPGYNMDSVTTLSRDLKTVATEMHNLFKHQGINGEIILVGHSLGGLHVRMYQNLYPEMVKGLVLLDAANSKMFERLPEAFYQIMINQAKQLSKVITIAQKGYLKYTKNKIPTFGLPENLLDNFYKVSTKPEYYYSMKLEVENFEKNLIEAKTLNKLNHLPLLVIGSKNSMDENILPSKFDDYPYEEHNKEWFKLQQELTELSSNSTFIASDANHYLNVTDAELVDQSILNWMILNFGEYED